MSKPKTIQSPSQMWELFLAYEKETKSRVRKIPKATPKGMQYEEHTPPLTIEGFKVYCHDQVCDINRYFYNIEDAYSEFVSIIHAIKERIRVDQIEGGMIGQYNSNLTARLNGLTERVDQTSGGEKVNNITVEIVRPNESKD